MWIFTTSGFISAVFKDGGVVVRSRDEESLMSLAVYDNASIIKTPLADYPYRLKTDQKTFAKWLELEAKQIDYPNFKSEVHQKLGYEYAHALNQVWSVMHEVEDANARTR